MKLKDMTITDLELLSYGDIAFMLIKENKKSINTPNLFKKICDLLNYSEDEYANKIGEFYTSLTNDKRFVMLDSAEWDLRDNHAVKISIDADDDDEDISLDEEEEETEEDTIDEEEIDVEEPLEDDDLDLDDDEDDIDDLTIVEEEELEE